MDEDKSLVFLPIPAEPPTDEDRQALLADIANVGDVHCLQVLQAQQQLAAANGRAVRLQRDLAKATAHARVAQAKALQLKKNAQFWRLFSMVFGPMVVALAYLIVLIG